MKATREPAGRASAGIPVAVLVSILVLCLPGCASDNGKITRNPTVATTTPSDDPVEAGSVDWDSCDDVEIAVTPDVLDAADDDGMQCSTIEVPVDHAEPDGPTTEIAIARLPATGRAADRIGSLVVNPGGPGGSGLEFLASSGIAIPSDLRDRFDVVSFDPRGIAASSPLDCLTQAQRAEAVDEETPDDPATSVAEAKALEQSIADGCRADDPELFAHMGTDQVAGDLDDIREAVGDEGLTFLGLSYGTRIAAAYATQFPDNVRALVLDGSVTPSRDLVEQQAGQYKGIVRAFEAFVEQCNADETCALAPDAEAALTAAADRLDAEPMVVSGSDSEETLTKDKFIVGVITALYDPSVSSALADAVAALGGDDADRARTGASFILDLAGQQSSQQPDGTYGNGFETQTVVNCLDGDGPLDTSELPRMRELVGPIPALLDDDPAADSPSCEILPTGDGLAIEPSSVVDRILVVGTEGDPATPIEWTHQMVEALGDPAAIIYGGSGHTASLSRSCVTKQVTAFFVDAAVPSDLKDCPRDPAESDIYAQIAAQFETMGLDAEVGACIADALRDQVDPLAIVALNGDDPDPTIVRELQSAAMGCR